MLAQVTCFIYTLFFGGKSHLEESHTTDHHIELGLKKNL